jgi:hypothetical protein
MDKRTSPKKQTRPSFYGEAMTQVSLYMPKYMIEWFKRQPDTMSAIVRARVQAEIDKEGAKE